MRIDEALAERRPLDVKFGSAVLHIEYQTSNYTIAQVEEVDGRRKEHGYLVRLLQDLVVAWDLTRPLKNEAGDMVTDDTGKVVEVPIDITNFADVRENVTMPVVLGVMRAIKEDQSAGEA